MNTSCVRGLEISDLHSQNKIELPGVFTVDKIPVTRNNIPRKQDISRWSYLSNVDLPEIDAEIGLLIGNNVADAYAPCEIKTGARGSPHATKTLLGWIVWNVVRDEK